MTTAPITTQSFSDRLRTAREESGLTTTELARRAGVNVRTVQRIEAGKHDPKLDTAHALAQAIGVPLSALTENTSRAGKTSGNGASAAPKGE